jgi:gluconolactonase
MFSVPHSSLRLLLLCCVFPGVSVAADAPDDAAKQDQQLIALAAKAPQLALNLTHLNDIIGPRLTGTPALKTANDWAAGKMKEYGLANVHHEAWTFPEGWVRGHARGRVIEPNNGRELSLASFAWCPGTPGKIEADVVILQAKTLKELEKYKGKLKGAIVLLGPPAKLLPIADVEKIDDQFAPPTKPVTPDKRSPEELAAFRKGLREFLINEGAAGMMQDAGKHLGLLFTTGSWVTGGADRPSVENKLPSVAVAHEHFAMLWRLASRPAPAKTRVELDVANTFVPGPLQAFNTVGEIRGSDKAEDLVIIGAHLDSWDLGQGVLDNGTGTSVVLETARTLVRSGFVPRRTIRFVLFTGEEQGLHGSKNYVKQHKDELPRITAAIVHDTGTGKVIGLGWHGRPELTPILEKNLATLKTLGVKNFQARGATGSDHYTFDKAGVPGCIFRQEIAGYRFAHHSQADTLELVREADLVQGVQVMAIAALRLANLDEPLPRGKQATAGVLAPGAKLEKLADGFKFTEGPAADAEGNVYFTDQPNDRIVKWSVDGKQSTFLQPCGRSNGLCFDSKGNLWACADEKNELWSIAPDGKATIVVKDYQGKLLNGPNDVWVRPDGGLYFTDPYYKRPYWKRGPKEIAIEGVYYLTPDRKTLTRVVDDLKQPNGIIGTPDGRTLYVADIGGGKTFAYDPQPDGSLANKRLFCNLGSDGMTIDDEGNVYLTGKGVIVFDKSGKEIQRIEVPERWTANVCFGDRDRRTLFITASASLYSIRTRTKGVGSQ